MGQHLCARTHTAHTWCMEPKAARVSMLSTKLCIGRWEFKICLGAGKLLRPMVHVLQGTPQCDCLYISNTHDFGGSGAFLNHYPGLGHHASFGGTLGITHHWGNIGIGHGFHSAKANLGILENIPGWQEKANTLRGFNFTLFFLKETNRKPIR
jgi:hypothetical protein